MHNWVGEADHDHDARIQRIIRPEGSQLPRQSDPASGVSGYARRATGEGLDGTDPRTVRTDETPSKCRRQVTQCRRLLPIIRPLLRHLPSSPSVPSRLRSFSLSLSPCPPTLPTNI
uniref:Uncharacterized protein n=1 Tax=Plectus sambesii TaxID=2011161 RepID=A0A914UJR8_9BILA